MNKLYINTAGKKYSAKTFRMLMQFWDCGDFTRGTVGRVQEERLYPQAASISAINSSFLLLL